MVNVSLPLTVELDGAAPLGLDSNMNRTVWEFSIIMMYMSIVAVAQHLLSITRIFYVFRLIMAV